MAYFPSLTASTSRKNLLTTSPTTGIDSGKPEHLKDDSWITYEYRFFVWRNTGYECLSLNQQSPTQWIFIQFLNSQHLQAFRAGETRKTKKDGPGDAISVHVKSLQVIEPVHFREKKHGSNWIIGPSKNKKKKGNTQLPGWNILYISLSKSGSTVTLIHKWFMRFEGFPSNGFWLGIQQVDWRIGPTTANSAEGWKA